MTNSQTQSDREFLNENSATDIRGNNDLMLRFIEIYKEHFFVTPSCISCGFTNKYRKLKNKLKHKETMKKVTDKKHVVKKEFRNTIFRIKNKKGRIIRVYGKSMSDDFAEKLIEQNGKDAL